MITEHDAREMIEKTLGNLEEAVKSGNLERVKAVDYSVSGLMRDYGQILSKSELRKFNSKYREITGNGGN